jgi:hypothetical protein
MEEFKYNFPKKILLSITTHGIVKSSMSKQSEREPTTFIIPEGIKLVKMNIATLGECNFMAPQTVVEYTKLIKRYEPYILRKGKDDRTIQHKIESIAKLIKTKEQKEELNSIKSEMIELLKKKKQDESMTEDEKYKVEDMQRFLSAYDKSYNVSIFNSGERTINKIYKRSNIEANKFDWIIKVINMPNQPDLLSYMIRQTRRGESEITLQEIVNFLKERGVEEIFLIDFSCALIEDIQKQDYISEREARSSRRSLKQRSIYGGFQSNKNKKIYNTNTYKVSNKSKSKTKTKSKHNNKNKNANKSRKSKKSKNQK